jgi:hypothetical protein
MVTALIIALTATALVLAASILIVLAGSFPRLAAVTARGLETVLPGGQPRRLDPRDRADMIARLWVL